nr:hypothetical protein Iba_chr11cCG11560 [Ipomoea batatas]
MKILEVITFGNDVGGVKEVEDGIIGDDLDEMEKVNNRTESETPLERTSREGVASYLFSKRIPPLQMSWKRSSSIAFRGSCPSAKSMLWIEIS